MGGVDGPKMKPTQHSKWQGLIGGLYNNMKPLKPIPIKQSLAAGQRQVGNVPINKGEGQTGIYVCGALGERHEGERRGRRRLAERRYMSPGWLR